MASPRSLAAALVISTPSMEMVPDVQSSSPAISRSSVDFPQPDGPTNTTNSPSLMSKSMDGMMLASPNFLPTLSRRMLPMDVLASPKTSPLLAHTILIPAPQGRGHDGHFDRTVLPALLAAGLN